MLNIKKGLALVLAAATALTFAPVASLSNGVEAEAAATIFDKIGDQTLTVGDSADYEINIPNLSTDAKFSVSTSNSSVVKIAAIYVNNSTVSGNPSTYASADHTYNTDGNYGVKDVPNGSQIRVFADSSNTGSSTIDIAYTPQGGVKQHKTFTITVNAKSDVFGAVKETSTDAYNRTEDANYGLGADKHVYVYTAEDIQQNLWDTINITDAANGDHYNLKSATILSGGSSYVTLGTVTKGTATALSTASSGSVNIKFIKKGTATLRLQATNLRDNKDRTIDVVINVWNADSTMKIGDNEITNSSDTSDIVKKTITLTADKPSADIGAVLDDAKVGEKLTYAVYSVTKDGLLNNSKKTGDDARLTTAQDTSAQNAYHAMQFHNTVNDLTVDSTGKVTATANALNATEQYYDILVTNNKVTAQNTGKAAWVRVVSIRNTKSFTTLNVKVDDTTKTQEYTVAAKYAENGDVQDGSDTKSLKLSTKDFSSTPYTATANGTTAVVPTSSDPSVVAVENGKLVAKKTGYSVLTFEAKSDVNNYGNATLKLQVTVVDQYIANKIDAENINLTLQNKKATIAPSSTPKTTYHFTMGHADASGKWVEETDPHLTLNKSTGEVTFDGLGIGSAQVQITGDAVNGVAEAPAAKVVTVSYTNVKVSDLNVTTKTLSLKENETGSIVATGTALSYTSSDENVATVDSTGKVTAVKAGTAVITVQSKGNDFVAPATDNVIVTVKAVYKDPAKVTGVKVTNAKGAKVTVKFTKDSTNQNMKYYVQKKVSGKTSGKSVGSNKTTLSVKKGATVKVRVKAYYYDATGEKHVGAYSAWKTLKTDKK